MTHRMELLNQRRLDRKIEIPKPNETQYYEILKIHAAKITTKGEIVLNLW